MSLALSEPFSSPAIALFDLLRIVSTIVGLLVVGAMTRGWSIMSVSRRIRRIGIALVVLVIVGSRLQNLGVPPTWQLWSGIVGIGLLGWAEVRRVQGRNEGLHGAS